MTFPTVQDLSMHWQYPNKSNLQKFHSTSVFVGKKKKKQKGILLTETIFPSVGMYAGLLDKRNFVCSVLKFVSSLAFCSTRGGLCLRL